MPIIQNFRYRPEIDGLRAIAVLAVVLYHAGFGCPGGYVGVDIFFVISGFLITSLIWKDLEQGTFKFSTFWERRARRIVPALVVVTLATLVAGWFLLLPFDFSSLGRAAISQALFAANIHYWKDTGYFQGEADEKPLLHTWSLAVEEQFYFVIPFLLWALFRFELWRGRGKVVSLLGLGWIASFALSCYGVLHHRDGTFFFLPTRAWELLCGSMIAFFQNPAKPLRQSVRDIGSIAALLLIFVPIGGYSDETLFPGPAALPPCLGTALFIWCNSRENRDAGIPTVLGRILAWRPLVFVGLISYSLYLWHWPLLSYATYLAVNELSLAERLMLVLVGFVLAVLSWRFVETPFRVRSWGTSKKSMFAYAAAGLVAVFVTGSLCLVTKGFPSRFSARVLEIEQARFDMPFQYTIPLADVRAKKLVLIGNKESSDSPACLVWGDSHAMAALPAFDRLLKEKNLAGAAITKSATAPVINWGKDTEKQFTQAVLAYIESEKPRDVILVGFWSYYLALKKDKAPEFEASLVETVQKLGEAGVQPWVLLDVPTHSFNVPAELSRAFIYHTDTDSISAKPSLDNKYDGISPRTISQIEQTGGRVLDPKPSFLDSTGKFYDIESDGIVFYRDDDHLTSQGAKLVLLPFLEKNLMIGEGLQ